MSDESRHDVIQGRLAAGDLWLANNLQTGHKVIVQPTGNVYELQSKAFMGKLLMQPDEEEFVWIPGYSLELQPSYKEHPNELTSDDPRPSSG